MMATRTGLSRLALASAVFLASACGGSDATQPTPRNNPSGLFSVLSFNHRAVTLSIDPAHPETQTLQLVATPLAYDGTPVSSQGKPEYTSLDTAYVGIDSTGKITARQVTGAPVKVVAKMTAPETRVTKADTAWITVLPTSSTVGTFSLPRDSGKVGAGYDKRLAAQVTDGNGNALPGINVLYKSSNDAIASIDGDGVLTPKTPGSVVISAVATIFGVAKKDSVVLTITSPMVFGVDIQYDYNDPNYYVYFTPDTVRIKVGQGVSWRAVDWAGAQISFDDPTNVGPGPLDAAGGNISYFYLGKQTRIFSVPGTYAYHDDWGIHGGVVIVSP